MMKISFILWQVIWVFEYRWKVWTFLSLVSCSHKDIIYDFHCFLFSGIKGGSSALAKHCVLANFSILCTSFHEITKSSGLQNGRAPERHQCVRTNHLSIEGAPGDRQGLWLSTHITDGHLVCNQNHIQAVFFTASFYFLSDLADHPPLPLPPLKMWQNYFMVFYSQLLKRVQVALLALVPNLTARWRNLH